MTIESSILIKCHDCEIDFRWVPNSTIKPSRCYRCQKLKDFAKNAENKIKLAGASMYAKKEQSAFKSTIYTKNTKTGVKRIKTPREKFYSSAAWNWFSKYILLYYSIDGEVAKCCTCGTYKRLNDKELHTGHWIKVFDANSSNYSTAFEFTNLGPQCSKCNTWQGGRERLMSEFLKHEHGAEELERLTSLSKQPLRLDDALLFKISTEYQTKFKKLLLEKGYKNPWM